MGMVCIRNKDHNGLNSTDAPIQQDGRPVGNDGARNGYTELVMSGKSVRRDCYEYL